MSRILNLVRLDGNNVPLVGCTGSCSQGHQACDCELAAYIPPDDTRVIAPPPTEQLSGRRARDLVIAVVALALFAFGIWIYPH